MEIRHQFRPHSCHGLLIIDAIFAFLSSGKHQAALKHLLLPSTVIVLGGWEGEAYYKPFIPLK